MKFTVSQGSNVPVGHYNAAFAGVEPFSANAKEYGEGVLLNFEIVEGEHEGEIATRICSQKFSLKSNLYKFAKALAGRDLKPGEDFEFDDYIGAVGLLITEETESGGTRVASFMRTAVAKEQPSSKVKATRSRSRKVGG